MSDPSETADAIWPTSPDRIARASSDEDAILRLLDKPLSDQDLWEATEQVAKPLLRTQEDLVR